LGPAGQDSDIDTLMIGATHLKTHHTATSLPLPKGTRGYLHNLIKGVINSKLHTATDLGRQLQIVSNGWAARR